jgi:fatty-acyl-CoA synthase
VQLVPNAKTTADEVQAFAQANSSERAAAPKEIILIEKMPLTDVGKPAKVQLRLDAARRAFTAALADVASGGKVSVDMVADPKQGNRAVIRVDDSAGIARVEIETRIQERMKYYATPYEISWL